MNTGLKKIKKTKAKQSVQDYIILNLSGFKGLRVANPSAYGGLCRLRGSLNLFSIGIKPVIQKKGLQLLASDSSGSHPARQHTPSQKCPFQRTDTMHAATAKACAFANSV